MKGSYAHVIKLRIEDKHANHLGIHTLDKAQAWQVYNKHATRKL